MPDLSVRVLSAAVMVAAAAVALWLGEIAWTLFVAAVAVGVLWEWWGLALRIAAKPVSRTLWLLAGASYIGFAAITLLAIREFSLAVAIQVLLMVIAVDVGAYFAGRSIGGPKIAPSISPSKTWAGLGGGIAGAAVAHAAIMPWTYHDYDPGNVATIVGFSLLGGALVALVAQTGDFFESWMKRRAGVKDSGALIPGHGGLFDRADGLVAVLFVAGLLGAVAK